LRDDISNGSGVIALTDRQTNTQTDIAVNNATLAGCAAGNKTTVLAACMLLDDLIGILNIKHSGPISDH